MRFLVLGGSGQVGWELQRALAPLGELVVPPRSAADLSQPQTLALLVRQVAPHVLVNAAAYTRVDDAESHTDLAWRVNVEAVDALARACAQIGALMVHYSTDYVFDGSKHGPYTEDEVIHPLNAYGRSKAEGERMLRQANPRHLLFRTSWVYAQRGRNFPATILRLARERDTLEVVDDQCGAPTSAELIADVTALCLARIAEARSSPLIGTYNLTARGAVSWFDLARCILLMTEARGLPLRCRAGGLVPIASSARLTPAVRPRNSRLDCGKLERIFGVQMPPWQHHLERWVEMTVRPGLAE